MHYNFYPGPSKIYPQVAGYFEEAMKSGILERNHRSRAFEDLYSETKVLLKSKLNIPLDYEIAVVSSATECWEIIAQSFINKKSYHFFNGAFGKKWWEFTNKITSSAVHREFLPDELPSSFSIDTEVELIALTHNETSNGSAIPVSFQKQLRESSNEALIAYDATSSMAGYHLDWELGDIWYASVQKCFGLPAGLGLMIVSPDAVKKADAIGERNHYNSFNLILENSRKNQTHHTPNIPDIFLLNRVLKNVDNISLIHNHLQERKKYFFEKLKVSDRVGLLIENSKYQSDTVLCLKAEKDYIEKIKNEAGNEGIIIGNGYGQWRENTFRIANFPAIPDEHFDVLIDFLNRFVKRN